MRVSSCARRIRKMDHVARANKKKSQKVCPIIVEFAALFIEMWCCVRACVRRLDTKMIISECATDGKNGFMPNQVVVVRVCRAIHPQGGLSQNIDLRVFQMKLGSLSKVSTTLRLLMGTRQTIACERFS